MRKKLIYPLVGILILAFGGLIATLIGGDTPSLGLDLQGGISVTQKPVGAYNSASLDLAVDRIRERVDSLGVSEPEILRQGDAIVVNLPGVKNQEQAEALVKVTGQVYLRPVLTDDQFGLPCVTNEPTKSNPTDTTTTTAGSVATSNTSDIVVASTTTTPTSAAVSATDAPTTTAAGGPSRRPSTANTTTTVPAATTTTSASSTTSVTETTILGATTTTAPGATTTTVAGNTTNTLPDVPPESTGYVSARGGTFCKVGPAGGTGEVFQDNATARIISGSGWGVTVGLRGGSSGEGVWNVLASECYNATATCPTRQLAIVLDGEVISAPTVQQPTFTGSVEITGKFSESEARNLARVLNSGSLPVKLETQAVQTVSPTLGKDSLHAAVISGIVGLGLVLLFMALYYRLLGFIVAAGLSVSGALIWTIISFLSKTQGLALSLSGIAGIIVSVGVTVDSYVVFFERLKDEVRAGRSMRNSAQRGFAGAWHTIVVADLVSLIGAAVLWYLTVGSVRNFAFFLGLSTLCDLFVAYFFTRPAVLLLARTDWMARRKVMGIEVSVPRGAS
ncbi:MAG TPA: protein translocase subunit SecD [Ilumatobacteraceae bacterium]|nr:protein translocase subunit SecD [Ilumatobacteraceae bacterium]